MTEKSAIYRVSRRQVIGVVGTTGVVALAGCSGEGDDPSGSNEGSENGDGGGRNGTPSQTTTPPPTETATAEVSRSNYVLGDSVTAPRGEQIPWAITEITNTSSVPHGSLRAELRFYDADDTLLEARDIYCPYIPADTTWRDYTRYYTETPNRVDRVETRITETTSSVSAKLIEGVEVLSSTFEAEAESGVDISVEVDLGGTNPDRVTVITLFFDPQDRYRGAVRNIERSPGETVAVSGGTIGIRTPPNLEDEQVDSFQVTVFAGVV